MFRIRKTSGEAAPFREPPYRWPPPVAKAMNGEDRTLHPTTDFGKAVTGVALHEAYRHGPLGARARSPQTTMCQRVFGG